VSPRPPWSRTLAEQVAAGRAVLQRQSAAVIAKQFKGGNADVVEELLETLLALGQARQLPDGRSVL
jgi:hypothetical protein